MCKSAKQLWNALETEYDLDDARMKRFNVINSSKFIMVNNKPLNDKIHEFCNYLRDMQTKENVFSEEY